MSQADCQCPDCRRTRPGKQMLRAFPSEETAAHWYQSLFGQPTGDLVADIEARLSDPAAARQVIEMVEIEGAVVLAILLEAPEGVSLETLTFEVKTIIGDRAAFGLERVHAAGLIFESQAYDYRYHHPEPLYLLPPPIARWLRPLLGGLLTASRPAPPSSPPPPATRDASWSDAIVLAAVSSVRPRLTSGRLFKKDSERLSALLAPAGLGNPAENIAQELQRIRLLGSDDAEPPRLAPVWSRIAAWAALPSAARVRERLLQRHSLTPLWPVLVEADGNWVEEIHVARRWRIVRRRSPPPPSPRITSLTDSAWVAERGRSLATWPEVERLEHDGSVFWRIRPEYLGGAVVGASGRAHVQPDFEIVAPPELPLRDLLFLVRVAELRRPDVVATFVLTAASIRRAAAGGLAASAIGEGLRAIAAHGLPPAVERAIRDWTGDMGRCTVRTAVLVTFDEPAIADRAAAVLGKKAERVGPTSLAVAADSEDEVEARLTDAGMAPRPRGAGDDDSLDDDDWRDDDFDEAPPAPAHVVAVATEPPEPRWVSALRTLRGGTQTRLAPAGALPASPSLSPPGAAPAPKLLALPPLVALEQGLRFGADLVIERDGRRETIRPLEQATVQPPAFVVAVGHRAELLQPEDIERAFLIPATARIVARNHPCPCGSGRKFKRCCFDPALTPPSPDAEFMDEDLTRAP